MLGLTELRDDRDVAADGGQGVAVRRLVGGDTSLGRARTGESGIEQSTEALLGLWRQVVLRVEAEAGDEKLAILDIVLVVDGVIL